MEQINIEIPTVDIQEVFSNNKDFSVVKVDFIKTKEQLEVSMKLACLSAYIDGLSGATFYEKDFYLGSSDNTSEFRKVLSDEDVKEVIDNLLKLNPHLKNYINQYSRSFSQTKDYYIHIEFCNKEAY